MQDTPETPGTGGPEPAAPSPVPPPAPAPHAYAPGAAAGGGKGVFDRARDILLRPSAEWPVIAAEPATVGSVFVPYALILAAIGPLAALIGGQVFGYSLGLVTLRPPIGGAIAYALISYAVSLASIYVLALIIDALAPNFGGTKNQVNAVKVAVYSWTAAWVAGIFTLIPQLSFLTLAGLYSLYLLFLGLPVLMRAPADKAAGYAAVVIGAAIVLWLLVGWLVWQLVVSMMMPRLPGIG